MKNVIRKIGPNR